MLLISPDTELTLWLGGSLVVFVLLIEGVRAYRRSHADQRIARVQTDADVYNMGFRRVDLFDTAKGPVSVSWRPHLDVEESVRQGSDPYKLVTGDAAADLFELKGKDAKKLVEEEAERTKEKIGALLTATPDVDLQAHASVLGIKLFSVHRSWITPEKESSFDADLARAQNAADAEKKYKAFLEANPQLSDVMKKRLKNKFDNRVHDLLDE